VLASALQRDLPEVEHACRVDWSNHRLFSVGDKRLMSTGNVVDSIFLRVFSFPLIEGNPATVLVDPHSLVITQSLAQSLFGKEEAMGKIVRIDDKEKRLYQTGDPRLCR
jgi:hypothetical protein